jgi:hypothetical protein
MLGGAGSAGPVELGADDAAGVVAADVPVGGQLVDHGQAAAAGGPGLVNPAAALVVDLDPGVVAGAEFGSNCEATARLGAGAVQDGVGGQLRADKDGVVGDGGVAQDLADEGAGQRDLIGVSREGPGAGLPEAVPGRAGAGAAAAGGAAVRDYLGWALASAVRACG